MAESADELIGRAASEEVGPLLRAYTALALARRAAELYAAASGPHPYLAAMINSQDVAARELDALLERVFTRAAESPPPADAEGEMPALLM